MQLFPSIHHSFFHCCHLWKLIFLILRTTRLIQCQINATVNISSSSINLLPILEIRSQDNSPLSEQIIYDMRNQMRKAAEMNDFDDSEDYSEDDGIEDEEEPLDIPLSPLSTSASIRTNSITFPVTATVTTTNKTMTITSEKNNSVTEVTENRTLSEKYSAISSSSRLTSMSNCLLLSFSLLYSCIHVNRRFLF